jgi:prevent-host-death family protein
MLDEMITAEKFKAECLKVIDRVKNSRKSIIITKRNIPVAKLVPIEDFKDKVFGKMRGTVHFLGDIIPPIEEKWNAIGVTKGYAKN